MVVDVVARREICCGDAPWTVHDLAQAKRRRRYRELTLPSPGRRDVCGELDVRSAGGDLKMPGALEALDDILRQVDSGQLATGDALERLLGAHIALRNARRLQTAMRSAR